MTRAVKLLPVLLLLSGAAYAAECPAKAQPGAIAAENADDCPWAGAARLLGGAAGQKESLEAVFAAQAPGILKQLDADRSSPVLQLWGESINYDELANGVIVNPTILEFISARLGAAPPKGKIAHAGLEHTYGYLFSLLPTKFGFKRARWVRPDIEEGLGLQRGVAGPAPAEGTLLTNITCLAGGIALKDVPAAAALLDKVKPYCAASLRDFSARPLRSTRLSEEVALPGGRKVTLRTDFVPFAKVSGGNSQLLIYSVYDSGRHRAYLITAFPVNDGFVKSVIFPAGLGAGKPVQTRYNAYVEGLTDAGKFKGTRSVSFR